MAVDIKPFIEARPLIESADNNYHVLKRQVKDLTHADSLVQLPFRGNCLNWVVGHLTQSRDKMLQLVDAHPIWTAEEIARYDRNSDPVTEDNGIIHFDRIIADFETAHQRLIARLEQMTAEDLVLPAKPVIPKLPPQSTGELLHFLLWHETYHVGQTELLRQLAGKNDKVI